jgi:ABC-type uncharacterized transport system substrate-binding protein
MRRRDFILLLASTAAMAPQRTHAQQAVPVVGFLNSASPAGYAAMASAFRQGLKEAGYVEGNNIVIDYRWAENRYETLPALAAGLVERHVTVIFANSPAIKAAKAATSTIPITFISGEDPVRLGFVADLNRPGGNATGVAILAGELGAKRLEFLRELVPHASTIAVLISSDWPSLPFQADIEIAAHAMGLRIQVLRADNEREIEAAFSNLDQARADALLVGPGPLLNSERDLLVALAAGLAVPDAYETRASAAAGGLMSYGADVGDAYRQAGIYTGRVLKDEKPADLPVLRATKLELVINLRRAKALGLTVSDRLLAEADEVIE